MDHQTKWIAVINQEYFGRMYQQHTDLGETKVLKRSTQVVHLRLRAASAGAAFDKASAWLKKSGISRAYVDSVCLDGMEETDIVSTSDIV